METFVCVMAAILFFDVIGKVCALYASNFERKPWAVAVDAVANVALLAWAVWLLAKVAH